MNGQLFKLIFLKGKGRGSDTGLYYYRARYYDTDIGRFISEDPKGFAAGINFYAYVNNNPVNANDPSGMDAYLGTKPLEAPSPFSLANHTVIVLMPNNPQDFANRTGWQTLSNGQIISTLSGHPSTGDSRDTALGNGKLIYTPNWPKDQVQNLTQLQRIPTSTGMTDTQFIGQLINSAGNYKNNAQYNLSPGIEGGYNSNSFTAGVINAAGGVAPTINYIAPGYSNPLPINNGGASGSWGTGVTGSWSSSSNSNSYGTSFSFGGIDFIGNSAAGGYLLYPNKPNNNQMQSVYSK